MASHEAFSLLQVVGVHVQIFFYPVELPQTSDTVVEHGAQHIAYRAIDDERQWVKAGCHKSQHHGFTARKAARSMPQ